MEDFETVKTAVFELSKKEQDELMLAILESRSGKKSKKSASAEPKEKREMSTGQKAWTDFIKHVATTVQGTLGEGKKFTYKSAMSVASALKKDNKMEADDETILNFYKVWLETATPPSTDSEAVVEPKAEKAEKPKKAAKAEKAAEPKATVEPVAAEPKAEKAPKEKKATKKEKAV